MGMAILSSVYVIFFSEVKRYTVGRLSSSWRLKIDYCFGKGVQKHAVGRLSLLRFEVNRLKMLWHLQNQGTKFQILTTYYQFLTSKERTASLQETMAGPHVQILLSSL